MQILGKWVQIHFFRLSYLPPANLRFRHERRRRIFLLSGRWRVVRWWSERWIFAGTFMSKEGKCVGDIKGRDTERAEVLSSTFRIYRPASPALSTRKEKPALSTRKEEYYYLFTVPLTSSAALFLLDRKSVNKLRQAKSRY